jgi:hypothetical protein
VSAAPIVPGAVTLADGSLLPQRAVTKIETTEAVPAGTNVTVPTANPVGAIPTLPRDASTSAPVVAVNTTNKWLDPQFLLNVSLCLLSVVTAVISVLPSNGPINWIVTGPAMLFAALTALTSFLRTRTNTVTK